MRAAEDHRVAACFYDRPGVVGDRLGGLVPGLDQRHEPRAGNRGEANTGVERRDERLVAAGRDRRLGREQADPAVARGSHRRGGLGCDHTDHRNRERGLQPGERRRGRGIAGDDDQLDVLRLQVAADLVGEAPDLRQRPRAVGEARMVAEVDEVLVGQGHEALVQHGESARHPSRTRRSAGGRPSPARPR